MNNVKFDISATFTGFLLGGLSASLKRVQAANSLSNDRLRSQALYILEVALEQDKGAWSNARALLFELSPKMEQGGYWDEWVPCLVNGIRISRSADDQEAEATLNLDLGFLYQNRGDYTAAQGCFTRSIEIFSRSNQKRQLAKAYSRLAHTLSLQENHDEAEDLANQALGFATGFPTEEIYCYRVLGAIAFGQMDWALAFQHFSFSLERHQQQGGLQPTDQREMARALQNLSVICQVQARYEEALDYNKKSLKIFETIHDPVNWATAQMNLGIIYSRLEQPDKALQHYILAKPIFQAVQENLRLAQIYTNQAIDYRNLQRWEQAEYTCLAAIDCWKKLGNIWNTVNAMDELALVYIEQRRFGKAEGILVGCVEKLASIKKHPAHTPLHDLVMEHLQIAKGGP